MPRDVHHPILTSNCTTKKLLAGAVRRKRPRKACSDTRQEISPHHDAVNTPRWTCEARGLPNWIRNFDSHLVAHAESVSICNVGANMGIADGCSTRRPPSPAMVLCTSEGLAAMRVTRACFTPRGGPRVSWVRAPRGQPTSACHPLVCQVTCAQFGHILDTNVFGLTSGHYF